MGSLFTTRRSGFATRREGEAEISLGGLLGSLARFGRLIPNYQLKLLGPNWSMRTVWPYSESYSTLLIETLFSPKKYSRSAVLSLISASHKSTRRVFTFN